MYSRTNVVYGPTAIRDLQIDENECAVCLEQMTPQTKVKACRNNHYICRICRDRLINMYQRCPKCRSLLLRPTAEEWINANIRGGENGSIDKIREMIETGIDVAIVGSGLFKAENIPQRYKDLLDA